MDAKGSEKDRDFLNHLETYLAKRDGVDKLLKISRYATKIILASSLISESGTLNGRLKSFESSVGVSRKAFRVGKFVQDINALRSSRWEWNHECLLVLVAYGGEGLYYFVEQFIWLTKSGLIDGKHGKWLQRISAWAELVGYVGSISLKIRDLRKMKDKETCVASTIEISVSRGISCVGEEEKMKKLREKKTLKALSVLQDLADGLMAIADIRDGRGLLSAPNVISSAENRVLNERGCIMVNVEESRLPLSLRLKISKEIANAVTYLHMAFPKIIIHRDVKPMHVFLDKKRTAKYLFPKENQELKLNGFLEHLGTSIHYIMPLSFVTEYTDVYSFGICLLVFLIGRPVIFTGSDGDPQNILFYVKGLYEDGKLDEVIDPVIAKDITSGQRLQVEACVVLARSLRCCEESDQYRPKMIQVAKELKRIQTSSRDSC